MKTRSTPGPTPPERPPYFRVTVLERTIVLRTPSLHKAGTFLRAVPVEKQGELIGTLSMAAGGNLLRAIMGAPDVLELVAALVGISWADPELELEAGSWDGVSDPSPYGHLVLEELHEAGWGLSPIARAGLKVAREIMETNAIDQEVRELTAFFRRPRGLSSASESSSSVDPSVPTGGSDSTN